MKTRYAKTDLFKPSSDSEYTEDNRKTIVGWLQELYIKEDTLDRKKYNKSLDVLRKHAGLSKTADLLEWEEKTSVTKAVTLLNKVVKEMSDEQKEKASK